MDPVIDLADPATAATRYWQRGDDGRVRCRVCPRDCALLEGQRGACYVRGRAGGEIVLTTHGRAAGLCIDPIEKKPLFHFLPGSAVLSFGTAGCNLACRFCQNWELSTSRDIATRSEPASPAQIAAAAERLGCRSVAFTYNDPVVFLEYAVDTAAACRDRGIRTAAVTAGYIEPRPRRDLFAHLDAANIDLKAFDDTFYRRLTGARLEPVLETIEYACRETPAWVELTTLLIPGHNDSDAEIDRLASWVADRLGPGVPLHFTAFHPAHRMRDVPATPRATLQRAREIARRRGLNHVYTGNVADVAGQSTCCPGCGAVVIERIGYTIGRYGLDEHGGCCECGEPVAGVFSGPPGDWGSRTRSVSLRSLR